MKNQVADFVQHALGIYRRRYRLSFVVRLQPGNARLFLDYRIRSKAEKGRSPVSSNLPVSLGPFWGRLSLTLQG